jgi:hypothetical protein
MILDLIFSLQEFDYSVVHSARSLRDLRGAHGWVPAPETVLVTAAWERRICPALRWIAAQHPERAPA